MRNYNYYVCNNCTYIIKYDTKFHKPSIDNLYKHNWSCDRSSTSNWFVKICCRYYNTLFFVCSKVAREGLVTTVTTLHTKSPYHPLPQSKIHAHNFTQHSFASKKFMSNAISINLHIKITIIWQYWNYWWYKIIIANHHKMLYNYSQQWVMEEIKSINSGLQQNVLNLHLPVQMQVSLAVCQSVCVLSNPSPLFEPCIQAVNSSWCLLFYNMRPHTCSPHWAFALAVFLGKLALVERT